jgi:hypothetical protein
MAKEKAKGEELSATGKQTIAHAYLAMDYYFDHLKKTVSSAFGMTPHFSPVRTHQREPLLRTGKTGEL